MLKRAGSLKKLLFLVAGPLRGGGLNEYLTKENRLQEYDRNNYFSRNVHTEFLRFSFGYNSRTPAIPGSAIALSYGAAPWIR